MSSTILFTSGLGFCIVGTALICAGDKRDGGVWMIMVAAGVAAVVVGIGVLRYLLVKGLKRKGA
jgi:hypothetical protein